MVRAMAGGYAADDERIVTIPFPTVPLAVGACRV